MVRILTFTNLYPSERNPRHGIFVEQRVRRLVESGRVDARVLVPFARTKRGESAPPPVIRHGISVRYAPFRPIHGVTTWLNPLLMALAARRALREGGADAGEFDLIDGHFLYPDGVAAVLLGGWLRKPVVLTARGSDVNVAARERLAGACIRWAAPRAAALVSVSAALREAMRAAGVGGERIEVLRNGVDLGVFRPLDATAVRAELGLPGPLLLSVGNLVPEKGHELVLESLARLDGAGLVVVGGGPERERLGRMALDLGLDRRVRWLDPVAQEVLARYYNAADVTVLGSTREGMPNVLLESLACGTPVVATAVGGAPEIITEPVAGRLVGERTPERFAAACRELLAAPPSRADRPADRAAEHRRGPRRPGPGTRGIACRCGCCTSSTTRCPCRAATRFAAPPSCASSAASAGRSVR